MDSFERSLPNCGWYVPATRSTLKEIPGGSEFTVRHFLTTRYLVEEFNHELLLKVASGKPCSVSSKPSVSWSTVIDTAFNNHLNHINARSRVARTRALRAVGHLSSPRLIPPKTSPKYYFLTATKIDGLNASKQNYSPVLDFLPLNSLRRTDGLDTICSPQAPAS